MDFSAKRVGAMLLAVASFIPLLAQAQAPLKPCRLKGLAHEALCGQMKRPLDPARPQGPQIELHYAVLPALARNKKPDPVFFFAGGPGQSAIDLAGPLGALYARLINRHDLVLIDQRGTGRSAPLQCEPDDPGLPLAETLDPQRQVAQMAACRKRLQTLPHGDLRFYTTPIAMQDADAVRDALGAERIDLIGASYGTRAVLEYMRQFPQRVRRAVADGVAPPDMVLPAASSADNQRALDAMFAACENEAACHRRHPELRARWRQLLSSLPRTTSIAHPMTGRSEAMVLTRELLLSMVRLPLYVPSLASALPQAIDEAAQGRFEPLAALASGMQGPRKETAIAQGMHFSVVCSEDMPRLASGPADAPGVDFGDASAAQYRQVCADWPRGAVPDGFYRMAPAPAATLLLSGGIDPATPPRHAQRVADALGARARHLVVPNAGHGVMAIGCMRDVLFRFVDAESDDEALKLDMRCVETIPRPPMFRPVEGAR
jgi:pimeloyl-ACP methyl ester carboxylesterase